MPQNEISFGLNTGPDVAQIQRLRQEVQSLQAEMAKLAGPVLGGNASPDQLNQFRSGVTSLNSAQSNLQTIQGSSQPGASGGATPASTAAAASIGVVRLGGQNISGMLGPSAQAYIQQQLLQMTVGLGQYSTRLLNASAAGIAQGNTLASTVAGPFTMGGYSPNMFTNAGAYGLAAGDFTVKDIMRGRQMIGGFARGATVGIGMGAMIEAQASTSDILRGGYDRMAHARAAASVVGSLIGAGIGAALIPIAGPFAPVIAAAAGGELAQLASDLTIGPLVDKEAAQFALAPGMAARYGKWGTTGASWTLGENISTLAGMGGWEGSRRANQKQLGTAYATLSSALMAGGFDPMGRGPGIWGPQGGTSLGGGAFGSAFGYLGRAYRMIGGGNEEVLQHLVSSAAPAISGWNRAGGNVTDLLMSHGLEATTSALRLTTPDGELPPGVTFENMAATMTGTQLAERRFRLGGMKARGSARAQEDALRAESTVLKWLPGGTDSEAFTQTAARMREARSNRFTQEDTVSFGIPMVRLEGLRERANLSPFAPGNRFAIELTMMTARTGQIGRVESRLQSLRKSGELSESQELAMVSQIENLRTANMAGVAALSEGVENRMPALSVGTPNSFRRFDSMQLAAVNLMGIGSPVRAYGAMGGRQARYQDEWVSSFGGGAMNPRSRTWDLNNGDAIGVLTHIANTLDKMAGGGGGGFNQAKTTGGINGREVSSDLNSPPDQNVN